METSQKPYVFENISLNRFVYVELTEKGVKHYLKTKNRHYHIKMQEPLYEKYYKIQLSDFMDVFSNLGINTNLYVGSSILIDTEDFEFNVRFLDTSESKTVPSKNLCFGQAIQAAKRGEKVAREGWNGSNMFAYIVPAASFPALTKIAKKYWSDKPVPYREYWALKTAQEDVATWTPSASDSLAEDWMIIK